ncbi:hypothetical protein C8R43DRAFT_556077 [Mycena crocata]|nr:hypothetical protein C8R43DRAFT_556077 [Mycena crocata]
MFSFRSVSSHSRRIAVPVVSRTTGRIFVLSSRSHTTDTYSKDVDSSPAADSKIHRVDPSSENVQKPHEPPSGKWSAAGVEAGVDNAQGKVKNRPRRIQHHVRLETIRCAEGRPALRRDGELHQREGEQPEGEHHQYEGAGPAGRGKRGAEAGGEVGCCVCTVKRAWRRVWGRL